MNWYKIYKNKIVFLFILSILSINLFVFVMPKKASAQTPCFDTIEGALTGIFGDDACLVSDVVLLNVGVHTQLSVLNTQNGLKTVWDKLEAAAMRYLSQMGKMVAKIIINKIAESTVNWINGGFNGKPAYISDISKFMTGQGGVTDRLVGDFISSSNLSFLCNPFKMQVSLALSLGYGTGLQKAGCTLTQVIANAQAATTNVTMNGQVIGGKGSQSDFNRNGGWSTWLNNTINPRNTLLGAYSAAKAKLDVAITDAKGNKIMDLANGQGALSLKKCTITYFDHGGTKLWTSPEYDDNYDSPPAYVGDASNVGSSKPYCTMATPGSIITGMLMTKSTQDVQQGIISGALSDGFDSIFSAFANLLMKKLQCDLQHGQLNGGNCAADYNAGLANGMENVKKSYDAQVNELELEASSTTSFTSPDFTPTDYKNPTEIIPTVFPVYIPSTSTDPTQATTTYWTYDPTSTSTGNQYDITVSSSTDELYGQNNYQYNGYNGYNEAGGANGTGGYINTGYTGTSALEIAQYNANALIISLQKSESAYQNNYLIAQNILTQAESIFATSSTCNMNYNRASTDLRSLLIRSNVVTNIEGTVNDSNRTIASIPWNLRVIKTKLDDSNAKMDSLTKALSAVAAATTIQSLTNTMTPINSTSFDIDSQSTLVTNIKTWLRGAQGMYNSPQCPIDLTKVMQITTASSTTTK